MNNKVQVSICLRPLVKHEVEAGAESIVRIVDRKQVVVSSDASSVRYVSPLCSVFFDHLEQSALLTAA